MKQQATIRLPMTMWREPVRGAAWEAELDLPDISAYNPFRAEARTQPEARRQLTDFVLGFLDRAQHRPFVVVGGDANYAGYIHVIKPEAYGWVVHSMRDGRHTGSWHGDAQQQQLLDEVLRHVGGTPAVIRT